MKSVGWRLFLINSVVLIHATILDRGFGSRVFQTSGNQMIESKFCTFKENTSETTDYYSFDRNTGMSSTSYQGSMIEETTINNSNYKESEFVSSLMCHETLLSRIDSISPIKPIAQSTPLINENKYQNSSITTNKIMVLNINQLKSYGYTEISYISHGSEGWVYKVYNRMKNETQAVKVFIGDKNLLYNVFDKMMIIKNFNHFNLLNTKLIFDQDLTFMEMDFYQFDLSNYRLSTSNFIDLNCRIILKQVIDGLYHMHLCNVIHNDIKPNNILINESLDIKITDFGIACYKDRLIFPFQNMKSFTEYKTYSPELKKSIAYTEKSDIYSFGVLIFYLYFDSLDLNTRAFDTTGDDAKNIFAACIKKNPEERMSAEQLKMHVYFDILYSDLFCFSKYKNFKFTSDTKIKIEKNEKKLTIKGENFEYKIYCCCCEETIEKYTQAIDRLDKLDTDTYPIDYVSKIRYLVVVNNKTEIIQSIIKPQLKHISNAFIFISDYQKSLKSNDIKIMMGRRTKKRKRRIKNLI
ncbi:protein kinase [Hamiltosporidium tvaerminnensis]|uniref:non-specific serine/threonine protein kinase n=1 Tax=Hamiltosporidium tvaerminnensis TaxID=1176355 RepID=A0A4V2JVS3_9MICR|nr:hypothetical protein LUQ84_3462 [Hamiltosporidium tvaerminnensis]TBU05212.1 protein kinase [Hamiltosporidium tvaerminnensis]